MRSGAIHKVVSNILEVVSDPLQGAGINVGKECFKVRYSDVAASLFGSQRTTFFASQEEEDSLKHTEVFSGM